MVTLPYEYSEAQKRFLKQKFAAEKEAETGCDCPGCEKCTGFVRGCNCDHDLTWLRMRHGQTSVDLETEGNLDTKQSGRIKPTRSNTSQDEIPF